LATVPITSAHAHLETIHPSSDGNGRAARALVKVMPCRSGVSRHLHRPLSAGLLRATERHVGD